MIRCGSVTILIFLGMACKHGSVRLMNGTITNEGRVEVCINGIWSSVCDANWTQHDATVVCNQLGYSGIIY